MDAPVGLNRTEYPLADFPTQRVSRWTAKMEDPSKINDMPDAAK